MAKDLQVVLLPWSAFGHMMPFFQLAIALAKSGVHVSFISTPRNIQRLPKLPPDLSNLIDLVVFSLPEIDRNLLPDGAEATVDIPFEKIQYLKIAYDLLKTPFQQFISEKSPNWIITDVISLWTVDIAQDYNIPLILFSVFSAAALVFIGPPESLVGEGEKRLRFSPETMTRKPEWVNFSSTVALRKHEADGFHPAFYGENASGIRDCERAAKILGGCDLFAVRTCPEIESEYLNLLSEIHQKRPVIPVGFLPPKETINITFDMTWKENFEWLDKQKPRSVVFVGFGSECKLSKDVIHEIAYGLELSELPFLWALRRPSWANNEMDDGLPEGFSRRVAGKGLVHIGWAPQMEILGHSSIGGSLFHSGWGSVIETLQHGHCLILLPFIIDQGMNARFLVEKGLGIEVERNEEDGSFSKEDIAKSLRYAMVSDEGEGLRARAREAAQVFGDQKLNEQHFGRFVEYLKKNGTQRKI